MISEIVHSALFLSIGIGCWSLHIFLFKSFLMILWKFTFVFVDFIVMSLRVDGVAVLTDLYWLLKESEMRCLVDAEQWFVSIFCFQVSTVSLTAIILLSFSFLRIQSSGLVVDKRNGWNVLGLAKCYFMSVRIGTISMKSTNRHSWKQKWWIAVRPIHIWLKLLPLVRFIS